MIEINNLAKRLYEIETDRHLQKELESTAISKDKNKRVYNALNVNTRILKTYYQYFDDVFNKPTIDNHQKIPRLKQLCVFCDYNNKKINKSNQIAIDARSNILRKALCKFKDEDCFERWFIVFILILNSQYDILDNSTFLYDSMPNNLIDNYDNYLKKALTDTNQLLENPAFGIFTLFSDVELLDCYLDLFEKDLNEFITFSINTLNKNIYIKKRIENCNKNSLLSEALIFSLQPLIQSNKITKITYKDDIDNLLDNLEKKILKLGGTDIILFNLNKNSFNNLKEFFNDLDKDEQNEIINCINLSHNILKTKKTIQCSINERFGSQMMSGVGRDILVYSKARRGQRIFKNNLFCTAGTNIKCAICGCEINNQSHLIASHILPWNISDENEKVDCENGLLLCHNHDFLFDHLLISFDDDGKIIFSDSLSPEDRRAYGLSDDTKINVTPGMKKYLKLHREALKKGHWDK